MDLARLLKPEAQTDITKQPSHDDSSSARASQPGDPATVDRILAAFQRQQQQQRAGDHDNIVPSHGGVSAAPAGKSERDTAHEHANTAAIESFELQLQVFSTRIYAAVKAIELDGEGERGFDKMYVEGHLAALDAENPLDSIANSWARMSRPASHLKSIGHLKHALGKLGEAVAVASKRHGNLEKADSVDRSAKRLFGALDVNPHDIKSQALLDTSPVTRRKQAFTGALEGVIANARFLQLANGEEQESERMRDHQNTMGACIQQALVVIDEIERPQRKSLVPITKQAAAALQALTNKLPRSSGYGATAAELLEKVK